MFAGIGLLFKGKNALRSSLHVWEQDHIELAVGLGAIGEDMGRPLVPAVGGITQKLCHPVAIEADPSEGAYPSGMSAMAAASLLLHQLTADSRYRLAAESAMAISWASAAWMAKVSVRSRS